MIDYYYTGTPTHALSGQTSAPTVLPYEPASVEYIHLALEAFLFQDFCPKLRTSLKSSMKTLPLNHRRMSLPRLSLATPRIKRAQVALLSTVKVVV